MRLWSLSGLFAVYLQKLALIFAAANVDDTSEYEGSTSDHIGSQAEGPPAFKPMFDAMPVPVTESSALPMSVGERFVNIVNREFESYTSAEPSSAKDPIQEVVAKERDDLVFVVHNNRPKAKRSFKGLGSALVVAPAAFFSHILVGQRLRDRILSNDTISTASTSIISQQAASGTDLRVYVCLLCLSAKQVNQGHDWCLSHVCVHGIQLDSVGHHEGHPGT